MLALACMLPALGCKGCREDHPYVPYSIGDAPSTTPPADDAAAAITEVDAGAFRRREATVAPPKASRFTVDGLDLSAPPERVFALALVADFDGDGARDAVALVDRDVPGGATEDAGVDLGEVVLYRGAPQGGLAAPQVIATPPALANGPSCAAKRRLAQVGKHSVALETGAACDHAGSQRWVAAIAISPSATSVHFRATVLDPADAPTLSLDLDGADRDGDGLDDVALRVTLEGGTPPFEPGPKVSALLRWFDRPAGMSRDPDEPEASLRALASSAATRAARVKDAAPVPRFVEQVRSLHRALCEGPTNIAGPRLVDLVGGGSLACGTSKALEEAGLAEVRAYAVTQDPLRAIAALDRAQAAPATHTAARTTDAQGWIAAAAPTSAAPTVLRALGAVPQIERTRAPAWGALAFEPSGKLLVRTVAGVVRVDPVQGDEASADDVQAWRAPVVSPDGSARWTDSYDACDGVALHATFSVSGGAGVRDLSVPVPPPPGARCEHLGARGEPATTLPVAWGPRGLEAIVGGEPLLFAADLSRATSAVAPLDQPVTLGAPRSPGGKVYVEATSLGILVRTARARLLRAKELDGGYLELRDCTVSDDGLRVACVRGGRAFVGVWPAE